MFDLAGSSAQDEVFVMQQRSARQRAGYNPDVFLLNPKANLKWLRGEQSRIGNGLIMTAIGMIFLIAGLGISGYFGYRYWYSGSIHQTGTIASAEIIDRETSVNSRRNTRSYYVEYRYFVNDQRYERRQQVTPSRYADVFVGSSVDIVYDKSTPWDSFLTGRWYDETERNGSIMFALLLGGTGIVVGLICLEIERRNRKYSQRGHVLEGRVLEATGKRGSKNAYNVTIRYTFQTPDGETLEKKATNVRGDLRNGPLPPPGTPLAVLYLSPKRVRLM